MSYPIRSLPVLQNWDCHVCGSCCKEYIVTLSAAEKERIEKQGWAGDAVVGDRPLFRKSGPPWKRIYRLNWREDGSCVFLGPEGRCRIHEKHGYETKPLPCRLFPFVLVPAGDHWRVGIRYACPSAAANKGRPLKQHAEALKDFAAELLQREALPGRPIDFSRVEPLLQRGQSMAFPDVLRIVRAVSAVIEDVSDPLERRWRKIVAMVHLCRQAKFNQQPNPVTGNRLSEFLEVIAQSVDVEVPKAEQVPPPGWVGRLLFRQAVAVFTRKDHGPDRGEARKGRIALFRAACRFAVGSGRVPRLHLKVADTTFEQVEAARLTLTPEARDTLARYYLTKLESLHFFGAANFQIPFWDGLEMLALTFPILMWVARSLATLPVTEAIERSLTVVDDHFGFNRALASRRQRVSSGLLSHSGELSKLIAWYGRDA